MTTEELIRELEAVLSDAGPEDAYTTDELCDILGLGVGAVRVRLRALKKLGRLEAVRVRRETIDGVLTTTRAYRILAA